MIRLQLTGNTYGIRNELKAMRFRWNPNSKTWVKIFDDAEEDEVKKIADKWSGVSAKTDRIEGKEKTYSVKGSWIFNLESMHDKLYCIIYDIEDGEMSLPLDICGDEITDISQIYKLIDEASDLEYIAKSRKVTSKEYGRIKQLIEWRVMQRYCSCMASGMSEREAGMCFEDM